MGFSVTGLLASIALVLPSLLLVVRPPADGFPSRSAVPRWVSVVEAVAQAACLVLPVVTAGPNRPAWLLAALAPLLLYYVLWARYLRGPRTTSSLYASLGPLPVPLAIAPVLFVALVGIGTASVWVVAAAAALAVGHVTSSIILARTVGALPPHATRSE
jgi:hypothetical protein